MGMLEKKPGGGICWRKTYWMDGWMDEWMDEWMDGWRGCQVEGQNSVCLCQ